MTGAQLNTLLGINAKHALYREDGKWYHHLKSFPGVLFDKNGYLLVNNSDDYNSYSEFQIGKELHIPKGISSVKGYKPFLSTQKKLLQEVNSNKVEPVQEHSKLFTEINSLIQDARKKVASTVNRELVLLYWQIGRAIKDDILKNKRADYGEQIILL